MNKRFSKLDIKDTASVGTINEKELESYKEFDLAKETISNLKTDAAETAECLEAINSTIKEYLAKMEKLKLEF